METSTGASSIAEEKLRNDDLPAAFWDAYPENPDNTDLQAINALLEESTPEQRAETYKVRRSEQLTPVERQQDNCCRNFCGESTFANSAATMPLLRDCIPRAMQ